MVSDLLLYYVLHCALQNMYISYTLARPPSTVLYWATTNHFWPL